MRTKGTPGELEWRRRLAVERVSEGYATQEVADFLGVDPRSVRRWAAAFRRRGSDGLAAKPVPGRPPRLSRTQEKIIARWLNDSPTDHGFPTDLWSAPRLARLIQQDGGIGFHPDYLGTWLRRRGYTPQKPRRVAREHDEEAVARWLAHDWARIRKKHAGAGPA